MITLKDYRNVMNLLNEYQIAVIDYSFCGNYDKMKSISDSISDYLIKLVDFSEVKND